MSTLGSSSNRNYAVFISYRHADNKEQGRQWATWLHHTLETYEVPPDLVGRTNLRGEPVPASLYPVFRDEEELPADADLSANIQRALKHSALLVVLCSPRAVESRFVSDEIKIFKELGKSGHILALMIDGEPNASDDPGKTRAGIRPEQECLPESLRYGVPSEDGSIDWRQRTEPIAADVRPENKPVQGWTTAAAYREELTRQGLAKPEIDRLSTAYEEQLQIATMKIIAGAIGLPLGEMTQRDKRHTEEKLKRTRQELSRTEFLFAKLLLDLEDRPKAYARLAKSLRYDLSNRKAAIWGLELLRRTSRGVLHHYLHNTHSDSHAAVSFSCCGSRALIQRRESFSLLDFANGSALAQSLLSINSITAAALSPDGRQVAATCLDGSIKLWNAVGYGPYLEISTTALPHQRPPIVLNKNTVFLYGCHWDLPPPVITFSPNGKLILALDQSSHRADIWSASPTFRIVCSLIHEQPITSALFSPDGKTVLTASLDKTVRLWNPMSGSEHSKPMCHQGPVIKALFTPDGSGILTIDVPSLGNFIHHMRQTHMWHATSGAYKGVFDNCDGGHIITFSADGERACLAEGKKCALWDIIEMKLINELRHEDNINSAVFSPDGFRIATTSDDESVRTWDGLTGAPLGKSTKFKFRTQLGTFTPDGIRLIAATRHELRVLDVASLEQECPSLSVGKGVGCTPDGNRLLLTTKDGFEICDITSCTPLAETHSLARICRKLRSSAGVRGVNFNSSGTRILFDCYTANPSGFDNFALLLDAASMTLVAELKTNHASRLGDPFSPDGSVIMATSNDGRVRIWDAKSGKAIVNQMTTTSVTSFPASFSSDGSRIITVSKERAVHVWLTTTGQLSKMPLGYMGTIKSASLGYSGKNILTVSHDGVARLWDQSGSPFGAVLFRHEDTVRSAFFSPDDNLIITLGKDNSIRVWDKCGNSICEPLHHNVDLVDAVMGTSNRYLIALCDDKNVRIWDCTTSSQVCDPIQHFGSLERSQISSDGMRILTVCGNEHTSSDSLRSTLDQTHHVRMWSIDSGEALAPRIQDDAGISTASFSPDGKMIITVCSNSSRTVCLWDVASGELLDVETIRLSPLLEIIGQRRLNERGLQEAVPPDEIAALRREFDTTTDMHRMLRWWWSDPFTRTINPSSTITVPDYVRRRIYEILDLADEQAKPRCLHDARDAFLNHPLVLLCEAEQGRCSDPAWLRQYAASRLLAEPHYLVPLEPPNAIGDAKANRQHELTLGLAEDCFLGARLLLNDRTGQTRTTDPKRIELAKQVLARSLKLAPENEACLKLAAELKP